MSTGHPVMTDRRGPGRRNGERNPRPVNPERVRRVVELRRRRFSLQAIGAEVGMSAQNVSYLLRRWGDLNW